MHSCLSHGFFAELCFAHDGFRELATETAISFIIFSRGYCLVLLIINLCPDWACVKTDAAVYT